MRVVLEVLHILVHVPVETLQVGRELGELLHEHCLLDVLQGFNLIDPDIVVHGSVEQELDLFFNIGSSEWIGLTDSLFGSL